MNVTEKHSDVDYFSVVPFLGDENCSKENIHKYRSRSFSQLFFILLFLRLCITLVILKITIKLNEIELNK